MGRALLEDETKRHKVKHTAVRVAPCLDEEQARRKFEFQSVCDFKRNITSNAAAFFKLMKFTKQSPNFLESDSISDSLKGTRNSFGLFPKIEKYRERPNAFVPLCKFDGQQEVMTLETCDLFTRGFTNRGLGYTFNSENCQE